MKNSKQQCDVLITNGRHAYILMRSLAQKGLKVWIADTYKPPIAFSKFCAGFINTPNPLSNEWEYIQFLICEIQKLKPICVLPLFDFLVLSKYKAEIEKYAILLSEDYTKVITLERKDSFCDYVDTLSILQPQRLIKTLKFPVIAKEPFGRSGEGVYLVKSEVEYKNLLQEHKNLMFSEFIDGVEFCVDCIRYESFFRASVYSVHKIGQATIRQLDTKDDLIPICRKILDGLSYNGVCGFDFIVDRKGMPYIIEANPRYTGGLGVNVINGFDIPYLHFCLGTSRECDLQWKNLSSIRTCSCWSGYKEKGVVFEDSMRGDWLAFVAGIKAHKVKIIDICKHI